MQHHGKLIAFCGPSGAGKSTILKLVQEQYPQLVLSISATTRPPRDNEEHGKHYYFIPVGEFKSKISNDDFLEYEEVYNGLFYGTLKSEMDRIWNDDKIPFLDLDVKGAANLKEKYGEKGLFVFIHPGTLGNLETRLRARGTESEDALKKRLDRAAFEMEYATKFDYVLQNIDLAQAEKDILIQIENYLNS